MEKKQINLLRETKSSIKANKEVVNELADREGLGWGVYNEDIGHFGSHFSNFLPKKIGVHNYNDREHYARSFREYIEKTLDKKGLGGLTAVEFGGPGSMLFQGFTPGFFRQTIGVCLKDVRKKEEREEDDSNHHSVIAGDILDTQRNSILEKVQSSIGTKKTDLIISRMMGPLSYIQVNAVILDLIIRNWYQMLNKNGLAFIQFPSQETITIEGWANALKKKYPEIDVQIETGAMKIHKGLNAPDIIPPAPRLF